MILRGRWGRTGAPALVLALVLVLGLPAGHAHAQVFYRITSAAGEPSWLLGTIHSEDPRLLDFPPVLRQALVEANVLALELVPDAELLARLETETQLPGDARLDEMLSPEMYRRTHEALRLHGLADEQIVRLRPWAAAMLLAQPPVQTGRSMDLELASVAMAGGTVAVALESLDEQLAIFAGLDLCLQRKLLQHALDGLDQSREAFGQLIDAYLAGDLEGLAAQAEAQIAQLPAKLQSRFREQGLASRNRRMAERAQPMIDEGRVLIAVGALHLHGEVGLVALLREQGHQVEAVY